jgi:hypothetical protein
VAPAAAIPSEWAEPAPIAPVAAPVAPVAAPPAPGARAVAAPVEEPALEEIEGEEIGPDEMEQIPAPAPVPAPLPPLARPAPAPLPAAPRAAVAPFPSQPRAAPAPLQAPLPPHSGLPPMASMPPRASPPAPIPVVTSPHAPTAPVGPTATIVPGEHRVVVHTLEGQVKRGTVRSVNLDAEILPLEVIPGQPPERLSTKRLKAVFFLLGPGVKSPTPEGQKLRVTFHDERQVAGFAPVYRPEDTGFFMFPADARTNTARIYIYRGAVKSIARG